VFKQIDEPYDKITELSQTGLIRSLDSVFDSCSNVIPYNDAVFTPPYSYTPHPAASVPDIVMGAAGTGKGPFRP